jgi:hypothetical protein
LVINTAENNSYTCPQGETLKPQEDGKKSGRTEQSGYQFKIQNLILQNMLQHLFVPTKTSRKKSIRQLRKALKKNKQTIRKTHNCTKHDENEVKQITKTNKNNKKLSNKPTYIGTIKDNGDNNH